MHEELKQNVTALENQMKEKLSCIALATALELISHLAANEIYPDPNDSNWLKYDGEMIFFFWPDSKLTIYSSNFNLSFGKNETDEALENFAHSSTNKCAKHKDCLENPGLRREVFGKVYEALCRSTFCFNIPPAKDLPYIKKIAEMRKQDIDNMPELKRALRKDINAMLDYKLKACAHDFVDYLYDKYELKHAGEKAWEVCNGGQTLCKIQLEPGKWTFTFDSGQQFENPTFGAYDEIKKLIGITIT